MKTDLDHLMAEREIDALVVSGRVRGNPIMYYMTNGARITKGILIKLAGHAPILCYSPIEREEAAKSGLDGINLVEFDPLGLVDEAGSELGGAALLYRRIFERLGVNGRVAFYGEADRGSSFAFLNKLQSSLPDLTVIGEFGKTIFEQAQLTKDASEIERMKEVGRNTTIAMQAAVDFIQRHRPREGVMIKEDGSPLTVGDVKQEVLRHLFNLSLEDPEGMIFSTGRDTGIPHSGGNADDPLRLGAPIIFDLFPCETGGGYYHDVTRTFSIGYARPEVKETYDQVFQCYQQVVDRLEVNELGRTYHLLTCDIFEEMGHQTLRTNPKIESGFVHSLGHGVGLKVHSRPRLSGSEINDDRLVPGSVFTIEPGLYYPDQEFGVRLEDVWTVNAEGEFTCLTDFPKELVIPL